MIAVFDMIYLAKEDDLGSVVTGVGWVLVLWS